MAADKVFLKCSAKSKSFSNGGSKLLLGVKVDELIKFANEHKNERGYLNLEITERRSVGQYGDTHSVALDTFKPGARQAQDDGPGF
jgi:hypothetical protein